MILAVNVNSAVDQVFFIDRFVPGAHMRPQKTMLSVGGKGLDTALVLQKIGAPTQAITFAAGKTGETLAKLLAEREVKTEFLWVDGETRTSNVIVETDLNRHSHITTSGYTLTRTDCDNFLNKIESMTPQANWAIMAGSLPEGAPVDFFREIIQRLHACDVKTLIDHHGCSLLKILEARPEIVKMNQEEFLGTFKVDARSQDEWITVCREQMTRYSIENLVITCGKDGILAFTNQGVYQAGCPEVKEVNAAGAGDAVSAALIYRLSLGEEWTQALTWAAAISAAVVLTEGTAEVELADIEELYPHAWVKKLM